MQQHLASAPARQRRPQRSPSARPSRYSVSHASSASSSGGGSEGAEGRAVDAHQHVPDGDEAAEASRRGHAARTAPTLLTACSRAQMLMLMLMCGLTCGRGQGDVVKAPDQQARPAALPVGGQRLQQQREWLAVVGHLTAAATAAAVAVAVGGVGAAVAVVGVVGGGGRGSGGSSVRGGKKRKRRRRRTRGRRVDLCRGKQQP